MLRRRQIIQDWKRVEDFEVGSSEYRSFEYHVVADEATSQMTLTIKYLNADCVHRCGAWTPMNCRGERLMAVMKRSRPRG